MPNIIEGKLDGKGKKFAIIVSRFNEFITNKLMTGALDCLNRHNTNLDDVDIIWAPGAFEIPLVAQKAAKNEKYDAVICLGAVIRGATPHFDYVASEVSKGIAHVNLQSEKSVVFGIITADTIEQAIERAGTKAGNKGWDAALTALEMANLLQKI